MNSKDKSKAIEIISASNNVSVSFNVPVSDNFSNVHQILITRSSAAVVRDLVEAGFSLFMTDKGLSIEKF